MKHVNYLEVEGCRVEEAGAHGVVLRTVIGDSDNAPNFHMRVISFEAGGATPRHSHPWEHEVFILKGAGSVDVAGKTEMLNPGDVVFVPPDSEHCFKSSQGMEML
ncbi:MAG: cupin domain-containing protein [Syntrophobacteraceae bacterium]|nr:cupin domain-containing protein [Syntrophobacteraceae bacterium]